MILKYLANSCVVVALLAGVLPERLKAELPKRISLQLPVCRAE